jgi:uncharacterized membrane protein YtjA (UPF0391 family)
MLNGVLLFFIVAIVAGILVFTDIVGRDAGISAGNLKTF